MTDPTVTIRPFVAEDWPAWRALRLRALADSPDAFAATLADAQARADETWQALLAQTVASGQHLPLLAVVGNQPAGLAWAKVEGGSATLYQVWVAPEQRGHGIAQALLARAIGWASERGATTIELEVTAGDTPAVRLYRRMGFVETGMPVPMTGRSGLHEQGMRLLLD
ncbi:GNAT family N-acetyltransferase [Pseudoduganella umbonata]|uniref:GNAT family N-acetyltransferase n=1 Tax=Pseudoduganella umbonata TaxID=864828 RepID=A0A4P8HN28_9BURK|nr:GNAT family N-acetyltransferase [Pseudoduganella umbonata]MBB3219760.1 ribosomal protein S18 acetylase RimI-like enzyme [Pseudoduganella umbonata]QCP09802.1 GNAT family N-acetyltransferase [Pseudoduganella umbonata]